MDSERVFHSLKRRRLSDEIVDLIRDLIEEGTFKPGQRLPALRDMAEQFGIGLSTIREALRVLSAMGVAEMRVGDGTYISRDLGSTILTPLSWSFILSEGKIDELMQARNLIEVHVAGLAAIGLSDDDRRGIRSICTTFEDSLGDTGRCVELDLEFHRMIATGSGNAVLQHMLSRLRHVIEPLIEFFLSDVEGRELAARGHREIVKALEALDPAAARSAMQAHLLDPTVGQQYLSRLARFHSTGHDRTS